MTPDQRLKKLFGSLAAGDAAQVQALQRLHRVYTGVVYEGPGASLTGLKPEQLLDYAALVRAVADLVGAEQAALEGYRLMENQFACQMDVVQSMQVLTRTQLQHCRKVQRLSSRLSRQ
jgi:hypothetical protein